jgi:glycosyltransferase involved in cell wall biosynthesis
VRACFVSSSAWEGLPTVLMEALACGCPIVSTDCPSGPREILESGAFGLLVPVGDDEALAEGIIRALTLPADRRRLRERAQIFSLHAAVDLYLKVLLGRCQSPPPAVQQLTTLLHGDGVFAASGLAL